VRDTACERGGVLLLPRGSAEPGAGLRVEVEGFVVWGLGFGVWEFAKELKLVGFSGAEVHMVVKIFMGPTHCPFD